MNESSFYWVIGITLKVYRVFRDLIMKKKIKLIQFSPLKYNHQPIIVRVGDDYNITNIHQRSVLTVLDFQFSHIIITSFFFAF